MFSPTAISMIELKRPLVAEPALHTLMLVKSRENGIPNFDVFALRVGPFVFHRATSAAINLSANPRLGATLSAVRIISLGLAIPASAMLRLRTV
jgi:hypothetical protein